MATLEHYQTCAAFNPLNIPWGQRGQCNIPYRTGVDGLPECRWCGTGLPHKSRAWCSPECRMAGALRMNWGLIRSFIIKRDQRLCRLCNDRGHEVDHINAVIDGGSDDPKNLRLLCVPCHKGATAALARRRLAERRSIGLPLVVN